MGCAAEEFIPKKVARFSKPNHTIFYNIYKMQLAGRETDIQASKARRYLMDLKQSLYPMGGTTLQSLMNVKVSEQSF